MKILPLIITFVNPQILIGLVAVAIPIIIHLFNLRRVKKVEFSNTALLKRIQEESSAKRKPVELMILAARILALSFLVFAFAQPLFKDRDNELTLGDEVLLYLDNSQSLSALNEDGNSGFDKAIIEATSIVETYPEGTVFHFIENSYSNSISADYTKESLQELLTEIQQVGVDRDFSEIRNRLEGSNLNGDIYYITDFQNKTDFNSILSDTINNHYLLPIMANDVSNIFIDTVYLENTFLSGAFANLLKIKLRRNFRDSEVLNLKLLINDQLFGTAEVDFGNQLLAEYQFEIKSDVGGLERIELQIEDPNLTFDNSFYASINQLDKVKVVEIYDISTPGYVQSLFEENEVFQFSRVDSRFLDNELIGSANLLIVNQVAQFSNQLVNLINSLKESGSTLIIVPDSKANQTQLANIGVISARDNGDRLELAQPDFDNPIFQGVFEALDENIEMPQASINFRILNSELDYLQFKNGRSFLSKLNADGNLFFFASPFDSEFTSFTNHALFVPVMYKLALGSKVNLSNLYYYSDSETIFYPIEAGFGNLVFQLSNGTLEITPDQRIESDRLILEIPKDLIEAGQYQLLAGGESIGMISFNIPKAESNLSVIDPQTFEELNELNHITVIDSSSSSGAKQFLQAGVAGIPLWKYALIVALFFLFVEIILIRYL